MMKVVLSAAIFGLIAGSYSAVSEPPEYRDKARKDEAGRWEVEQNRRADRMAEKGKAKESGEVRDYAAERVAKAREAEKVAKDTVPDATPKADPR